MKAKFQLLCSLLFISLITIAQETPKEGLTFAGKVKSMRVAPSLVSKTTLNPAIPLTEEPNDGRSIRSPKANVVPGKDPQVENDYFSLHPGKLDKKIKGKAPERVFEVNNNVSSPSDPALAVGPDHVFIVYNTGFIIYDKEGNDLTGPSNVNNIFSSGGCCDLTVSYDNAADRWVLTYLFVGAGLELAVSDGPDPTTSQWFVYSLPQVSDYNKLSVWRDGYYITDNGSNDVWAVDRTAALAGDSNTSFQGFAIPDLQGQGFTSAQVFNVINDDLPATGGAPIVYMRDDGFAGVSQDQINIWTINVDFATPANSSVSSPEVFPTTPFINVFDGGDFSNLDQPEGGIAIDALQSTIMNQAQFRKFPTYNSAIFNFVVDTDASAGELAGIRWYEFRQDGDGMPWSMFQEGTYNAPDGKHAWNGSMSMDSQGNIGLGYTSMAGPTTPNPTENRVGSFYTGRFASDATGVMSISEQVIGEGNQNIPGLRFGDYSKVDVDPSNDKEFWFITEYRNNGGKNIVGVFQIAADSPNDVGVVSIDSPSDGALTAAEAVEVTLFNFGTDPQSNFPVTLSVDGVDIATETFTGTIPSSSSLTYTFTATADLSTAGQTYSIMASTGLVGDANDSNNAITKEVKHVLTDDVGVSAINSPATGFGLGNAEVVSVTISNFGSAAKTGIPVFYTLDGGAQVTETFAGTIAPGETADFDFSATVDLSGFGDYVLVSGTALSGDMDTANDETSITITNSFCTPESNCESDNDGVTMLTLVDQSIATTCGTAISGYSDDTSIIFNFIQAENPFEGTVQLGFNDSVYAIWIDFNDNSTFEPSELVANGSAATAGTDVNFTIDFNTLTGVSNGMHLMRVRGEDEDQDGDVLNPCEDLEYGRTNDYTANITGVLGVDENSFVDSNLKITYLDNDQFEVSLNSSLYTNKLPISVFNTLGQKLAYYTVENDGAGYKKVIDMSYVSAGIYFIKVGNDNLNLIKRIIVK